MSDPFTGEIRLFPYFNYRVPVHWAACNGQLVKIADYDSLFALLGTRYGGDGVSTFGLPNLNGRIAIGQGQGPNLPAWVIGQSAGTETVTLTEATAPTHSHALIATANQATSNTPGQTVVQASDPRNVNQRYLYPVPSPAPNFNDLADDAIVVEGASAPHENLMPGLCLQYCICLNGVFPVRS